MAAPAQITGTVPERSFGGAQKVAALLLAMENPIAAKLLKRFDPLELRQITRAAAELGAVPMPALEVVIEEFAGHFSLGPDLIGSAEGAQQLLGAALPEQDVSDIMADVLGNSNQMVWERLSNIPEQVIATYLAAEHPQTAALVLSRVTTACAARVFGLMAQEERHAISRRMLSLKTVAEPVLKLLESSVGSDILSDAKHATASNTHARMADILNKLERDHIEAFLLSLSDVQPETAAALRGMLFNFEDIGRLNQKARLMLFEKVSTETVIMALRGADAELKELALSSLAARARRMVDSELSNDTMPPAKDISKARRAIAETVLDLADRGLIDLSASASQ